MFRRISILLAALCVGSFAFGCQRAGKAEEGDSSQLPGEGGAGGHTPSVGSAGSGGESTPVTSHEPPQLELKLHPVSLSLQGVEDPTDMVFLPPGEGKEAFSVLILTRHQELHLVSILGQTAELSQSWLFAEEIYIGEACAPSNIVLDPEFEQNQFIYVSYCPEVTTTRLVRYRWSVEAGLDEPATIYESHSSDAIVGWHRFGSMGFEEDGETLWMLVGEHGQEEMAQDLDSPLGTVVRVRPNRERLGSGHTAAQGNLAELSPEFADVDPSVFAYGLRSPWRGARDSLGRLWIGDVGADSFEELNLLSGVGQNFAWPQSEGPCLAECNAFTDPVLSYSHESDSLYLREQEGSLASSSRSIWVGDIYSRPTKDRYSGLLDDVVVFGDFFTGFVRALSLNAEGAPGSDQAIGLVPFVVAWRQGPDGYVYALDLMGQLQRLNLGEALQ